MLNKPGRRRYRRKRVQKRAHASTHDIWDPEVEDLSGHHPAKSKRRKSGSAGKWVFQIIAFLCLGFAIPYGVKWSKDHKFFSRGELNLTRLLIETDGNLTEAQIAESSGLEVGMDLRKLNIKSIQERLENLPMVKSAEVIRRFPDSMTVRVKERVALAWLSCPDHEIKPLRDGGLLIDAEGSVFDCIAMDEEFAVLPTIEVSGIPCPVAGAVIESFQVTKALELIQASKGFFLGQGLDIIDIRTLKNWGLLCRYSGNLMVTFHTDRIEEGLRDLADILKKSEEVGESVATVNLVPVKNIPVTFRSEIETKKWQNTSGSADGSAVKIKKEIREKHLRSILRGG